MKLVIFGLTVTSSWGNGHATIWRGLLNALAGAGHEITFFERDVPYYAAHRDLHESPLYRIELYRDWDAVLPRVRNELGRCDGHVLLSDAVSATEVLQGTPIAVRVFYDLDTPVTLDRLRRGENVEYIPPDGLSAFDLVLSYTGGRALDELKATLGAREVAPLYGSVDPAVHRRVPSLPLFDADLS